LPLEAFRFFIEQDLLFLPAFARCMAIVAAKSSGAEELDMVREEALSDRRRQQLAEIFMMSSRLEGMFWEMAYILNQWPDLR